MSLNISVINKRNLEQIIQFPDQQGSHIKSYRGQLSTTGEGLLERAAAFVSGSYFAESLQVIESTCSYVLMVIANNSSRSQVLSSEDYQLIVGMQIGLGNIKKVYTERYGKNNCISRLEVLEKHIRAVRDRFFVLDELEDWTVVPKEALKVSTTVSVNPAQGQLPGKLASIFAGIKTAAFLSTSGMRADSQRARVLNSGMQFKSADVYAFIEQLGLQSVAVVHDFYLPEKSGINILTLDQITSILDQQPIVPGTPTIIPINFMSQEVFGRNHNALIVIKDNVVEYYDAKGVFSQHRQLADKSHTLRDVLAYCQKKWAKEGKIVENPNPHQTDANNCGMFVCKRIQEIFKLQRSLGSWEPKGPSISQITEIRRNIADIAYPLGQKPENEAPRPSMAVDDELDAMLDDEPVTDDEGDWVKS